MYVKNIGKCQKTVYSRTSWNWYGITCVMTDSLCFKVGGRADIEEGTLCYIKYRNPIKFKKYKGTMILETEMNKETFIVTPKYEW